MPVNDIRPLKMRLRAQYRAIRTGMTAEFKAECDSRITARVGRLWQYRDARQLLVYVSTPIEVDTRALITQALADGKCVAVPRCIPDTRQMAFYYIHSLEELSPGSFGVDEPQPLQENLVTDFSEGLCIVPAFCYDFDGYRLGYGKGYYDRFLAKFGGRLIGICYSSCVRRQLPHGRYDRPVELIVTENYIRRTDRGVQPEGGEHDGR